MISYLLTSNLLLLYFLSFTPHKQRLKPVDLPLLKPPSPRSAEKLERSSCYHSTYRYSLLAIILTTTYSILHTLRLRGRHYSLHLQSVPLSLSTAVSSTAGMSMLSLQLKEFLLGSHADTRAEKNEKYEKYETDGTHFEEQLLSSNQMEVLKRIESESKAFVSEWESFENDERKIGTSIESILQAVSTFRTKIDDSELLKRVDQYSSLRSQVQLLILARKLSELQNFSHIRDIPILVQDLMNILPKNIQNTCKIFKSIISTVTMLKKDILQSFHINFDLHLESNADSSDGKEMWSTFLGVARDWLLSYALVSLLPPLISDSQNAILEKYAEALDEVLTPLWGRFHFHLSSARESKSFEQFVWTFSYAKSFLTLLIDLCTQLTSSGQLEKLHPVDFKASAIHHVTEKAVRFVRAHLAQAIVDNSPMRREDCMSLVEHTLDFDHSLSAQYLPPLSVSAVLYDARTIHTQWVSADFDFFQSYLLSVCASGVYGFRMGYDRSMEVYNDGNGDNVGNGENGLDDGRDCDSSDNRSSIDSDMKMKEVRRCFSGIYDCLHIFSIGLHRYANLPFGSQEIFVRTILEPILNIIVGLFYYNIRSDPILYSISNGLVPPQCLAEKSVILSQLSQAQSSDNDDNGHNDNNGSNDNMTTTSTNIKIKSYKNKSVKKNKNDKSLYLNFPKSLQDFIDSAKYFQICLTNLDPRSRSLKGNKLRFQENWRNTRDTFPQDLITKKSMETSFSPLVVIKNIFEMNSPYSQVNDINTLHMKLNKQNNECLNDINDLGKNNRKIDVIKKSNGTTNKNLNNDTNNNNNNTNNNNITNNMGYKSGSDDNTMGGPIDFAGAQVMKMSTVLTDQWDKLSFIHH